MDIMAFRDYRTYLRSVLEARVKGNPSYSLRAFAKALGLSAQMLSFVLNNKKGISPEVAAQIADKLGLNPSESSYLLDLVALAHSRSALVKSLTQYRIDERLSSATPYATLDVEAFHAISDWHHYAILELTFTSDFRSDPKWIAERLGISSFEAAQALDRLKKLELLEIDKKNHARKTDLNISASYGAPSAALRKLSKQLLEKAIDSLESQSIEERDLTNITMAIDPKRLPEAKQMIAEFRRRLCAFLEQGNRSEVYVFAPSLFKITKPRRK